MNLLKKYFFPLFTLIALLLVLFFSFKFIYKPITVEEKEAEGTVSNPELKMIPAGVGTSIGESFDVDLVIDSKNYRTTAVDIVITYDQNVLRVNTLTLGSFFPAVLKNQSINNGVISFALGCLPTEPKQGTGVLAKLNVTVLNYTNTVISYTSDTQVAAIGQTTNIVTSLSGVNILVPSPTPLPTITPVPPTPTINSLTNTPTPIPPSSTQRSKVLIYASGTQGGNRYPTMTLLVDNETKAIFYNVINTIRIFTYDSPIKINSNQVKVVFVDDYYNSQTKEDRNLRVDKIIIDDISYQSENFYSTGTHNRHSGCKDGYKNSDWLHCNGYFDFSKPKF